MKENIVNKPNFMYGDRESKLQSFHEYAQKYGYTPKIEVLSFKIEKGSKKITEILGLVEGSRLYKYKRLFYLDDEPVQVEESFCSTALFPDLKKEVLSGSKYHYIENIQGKVIRKSRLILEPMVIDYVTARLLKMKRWVPITCIRERGFLDDGTIFEYTEAKRNISKYPLSFIVVRNK